MACIPVTSKSLRKSSFVRFIKISPSTPIFKNLSTCSPMSSSSKHSATCSVTHVSKFIRWKFPCGPQGFDIVSVTPGIAVVVLPGGSREVVAINVPDVVLSRSGRGQNRSYLGDPTGLPRVVFGEFSSLHIRSY